MLVKSWKNLHITDNLSKIVFIPFSIYQQCIPNYDTLKIIINTTTEIKSAKFVKYLVVI